MPFVNFSASGGWTISRKVKSDDFLCCISALALMSRGNLGIIGGTAEALGIRLRRRFESACLDSFARPFGAEGGATGDEVLGPGFLINGLTFGSLIRREMAATLRLALLMISVFQNRMYPSFLGAITGGVIALSIAGCSLAPGMKFSDAPPAPGVKPILMEITPQLLKDEREAEGKSVDADAAALFGQPQPYTVGIGDVLAINLLGQTDIPSVSVMMAPIPNSQADSMVSNGYAVDQDGEVHLPYVGAVKVAGLTMRDLRKELEKQFAKYIRRPDFTVNISSYRSKRIYISGEVKSPGVIPIIDIPMTLPEALGLVGGWTNTGDPGAVEINRDGHQYVVNIPKLAAQGMNPARIMLKNGDFVRVPSLEESKVYVIGDVVKPSALLRPNSRLTLNDALSGAGGVNPESGNPGQVYVVRHASDTKPEIFHLDASSPVALALADGFELQPKDVVYVDAAPLARWNRVISLVLPTAQLVVDSKYLNIIK